MQSETVPMAWKTSYVIPRYKRGSRFHIENYRPINHTSIILRIMERIIKSSLIDFYTHKHFFDINQHGFINSRSCTTCHYDFLNYVTSSIDSGKALVVVYLDLQKAFDKVPHSLLLHKLHSSGIGSPLLEWFSSYFHDRSQIVKIDCCMSSPSPITSGVIQGSVLGPLLFLVYVNDLFSLISSGRLFIYADDIKIIYTSNPPFTLDWIDTIQSDLRSLEDWCSTWGMRFSTHKCSILSYGCTFPPNFLTLHASFIPSQSNICDLGLNYSCKLNFSAHVNSIISKARYLTWLLFRTIHTYNARLTLFKTSIRPLLEYCPIISSSLSAHDRISIDNIQRTFTKKLFGSSNTMNYRERCDTSRLDPLWLRRLKLNLIFLFRLSHSLAHSSNPSLFRPQVQYDLRNVKYTFCIPRTKSSVRSNFFLLKYLRIWNDLPLEIRSCEHLTIFKRKLYGYLNVEYLASSKNLPLDTVFQSGLKGF